MILADKAGRSKVDAPTTVLKGTSTCKKRGGERLAGCHGGRMLRREPWGEQRNTEQMIESIKLKCIDGACICAYMHLDK